MGGGPDKEHLLIALWDPEPVHFTSEIKRRFPYIDINYVQIPPPTSASWKQNIADSANAVPAGESLELDFPVLLFKHLPGFSMTGQVRIWERLVANSPLPYFCNAWGIESPFYVVAGRASGWMV